MDNSFKIRPLNEVLDFIDKNRLVKVDTFTMAKVYWGTNKLYYLIPAVGIKGIESDDQGTIDSILATGHIPIEEENPNIFQKNAESISILSTNANEIISTYFKKYNLDINTSDISFDHEKFQLLVNKLKGKNRFDEFFFLIGILIGEKIRIENSATWVLEKRYGYNPYYEPMLFSEKNKTKYDPWYWLSRSLYSGKKFNFTEEFLQVTKIPK